MYNELLFYSILGNTWWMAVKDLNLLYRLGKNLSLPGLYLNNEVKCDNKQKTTEN